MSWDIVLDLLSKGSSQNLVFLTKINSENELALEIAALANCNGGKIVLGIDNTNGHLLGCDYDKDWILNVAKEFCSPPINVSVTTVPRHNRNIMLIDVPEGDDKPYMVDDVCYVRENKLTRIAKSDEEKNIKGYEGDKKINARQKKALGYVQEHATITNRAYRDQFGVSHKTAHIELTDMVEQDLFKVTGAGRNTSYILINDNQQQTIFSQNITPEERPTDGPSTIRHPLSANSEAEIFNAQADLASEEIELPIINQITV